MSAASLTVALDRIPLPGFETNDARFWGDVIRAKFDKSSARTLAGKIEEYERSIEEIGGKNGVGMMASHSIEFEGSSQNQ
jgi:hypothetical protein